MSAVAYASAPPSHEIDLDVQKIVLDVANKKVRGLDTRIDSAIVGGELERTIDGASTLTLTLHDPKRALLQSGMFQHALDVRLDRLFWRLAKVGKADSDLTLTFEDREVALLRQNTRPAKATRGPITRAEFALSLVRQTAKGKIPFVCPELHARQPIGASEGGAVDTRDVVRSLPYQFRRGGTDGEREDTWTCLMRLAEEVNWRCFCSAGAVWFISEPQLMKAKPRLVLSEASVGVKAIDFDVDAGKPVHEATVVCRARRWVAAPGAVVELADVGPANGKWLVATLRRGLFDADAEITLKRPGKQIAEPAAETETIDPISTQTRSGKGGAPGSGGFEDLDATHEDAVDRAYATAQAIHGHRYPYVWGGGHGGAGTPTGGGYDCSGSSCAVLAAGGLGYRPGGPVDVSGTMMSWGEAGRGAHLTVYANSEHVFLVFHTARGDQHFGTGDWGKGWNGPGFNPSMHPTSRFVARHWPGT